MSAHTSDLRHVIWGQFAQIFGPPDQACLPTELLSSPRASALAWPLAAAYADEEADEPWRRHPLLREALAELVARHVVPGRTGHRRDLISQLHAWELLRPHWPEEEHRSWGAGLLRIISEDVVPAIQQVRRLCSLSSANVGYGTNHLAVCLSNLAAAVAVLGDDAITAASSEPEPRRLAEDLLRRFMDYMHADGYWPECDGPALSYNWLTAISLYWAARELGQVERYREQLARTARFHAVTTLPGLSLVDPINGRTQLKRSSARPGFLGFDAAGKALHEQIVADHLRRIDGGESLRPEEMSFLWLSHFAGEHHVAEAPAPLWSGGDRSELLEHHAVLRRQRWIVAVCNQPFRPRPDGHWNLDYTALIALFHDAFGTVLHGCNSKDDPLASAFHVELHRTDVYRQDGPLWAAIPDGGRIVSCESGVDLQREYRGFDAQLSWRAQSPTRSTLELAAYARLDRYPVEAALQPPLRFGSRFVDGKGVERVIGEEPLRLDGRALGNAIVIQPQPEHERAAGVAPARLRIVIPDDAVLHWPHALWNPYDTVNDRYTDIADQSVLLLVPVGAEVVTIGFELQPV